MATREGVDMARNGTVFHSWAAFNHHSCVHGTFLTLETGSVILVLKLGLQDSCLAA